MLRVETFSRLPDFSTEDDDDGDDDRLSVSQLLLIALNFFGVAIFVADDKKPVSNVFVLLKGFLSKREAQFSSALLELVIDARRVGWVVVQLLLLLLRFNWLLLLIGVDDLVRLISDWWCGLHGLHVCALRPEEVVEDDAAKILRKIFS